MTVTDEVGRKTRTISDAFLDHTMQVNKTEVLDMDGVTVYATTANVTKPTERKSYVLEVVGATTDYSACASGNCNSSTRQQITTTYNGLGQVLQRQLPQQSGATPYTAYEYYADGSLKKSTDARGAYAMLNYNKRGLTTSINYTVPGGVEATPNVSFSYDANGNRETMTDGVGSVNYSYNTLNRLLSETRTFTGLAGSFPLSYEYYNATGQLKKITDPFGDSVSYEYDLAGRTRNITGSAFAGVTSYVTNINYRAWGGTKSLTGDNGTSTATMGYNSLMRIKNFQMGSTNVNYSYFADGRLYQTTNPGNAKLNQYFNWYDPYGRVTYNSAISDANVQQFYQNLFYDALGHQTYRYGRHWWMPEYINGNLNTFQNTYQFTNNKITSGWEQSGVNQSQQTVTTSYDNEGNTLTSYAGTTPGHTMMYDAASRITRDSSIGAQENFYDGDGAMVKDYYVVQYNPTFISGYKYHLRSSLLGGEIVTTLDYQGAKAETSVYASGQLLAVQKPAIPAYSIPAEVKFNHRDPHYTIDFSNPSDLYWIDPFGTPGKAADAAYIAQYQTSQNHPDPATVAAGSSVFYANAHGAIAPNSGLNCKMDGAPAPCDSVLRGISRGHASRVNISLPGLVGDINTQALVTSFSLAASTRNGQPTGGGARITGYRKVVIPGVAQQTMAVRFESGEAISLGEVDPGSKDIVGYDAIWGDGNSGQDLIPLPEKQSDSLARTFLALRTEAKYDLFSKKCHENVFNKLKSLGFNLNDFSRFLEKGSSFYDGLQSNHKLAGFVTSEQAANNIPWAPSKTVSEFFNRGGNTRTQALTAIMQDHLTVFFRPDAVNMKNKGFSGDAMALMLHEALHGYGKGIGYDDRAIQEVFFGKDKKGNWKKQVGAASNNITQYIKKYCY